MLTLALVENLQRADLNAVEEAEGYQRLIGEFGLTQQQVADAVGKDRTTITNLLRVLALPPTIRAMVEQGQITTGHARALLVIKDGKRQRELANEIVARQLSVRQTEARARDSAGESGAKLSSNGRTNSPSASQNSDPAIRRIEEQLRRRRRRSSARERTRRRTHIVLRSRRPRAGAGHRAWLIPIRLRLSAILRLSPGIAFPTRAYRHA
jgi:ParB family chromosome partitioning protein